MTVALVQQVTGSRTASTNLFTTGIAATTIGNAAFIIVGPGASTTSGAITSVTDDAAIPNTWSRGAVGFNSGKSNSRVELWWCNIASSFSTVAVATGASQIFGYNFTEWSGLGALTLDTASPDDSAQTVAATPMVTPTITPLAPLIVFAAQHESGTLATDDFDPTTATPTSGWVEMAHHDSSSSALGRSAYIIPTSNGSFAGSWTLSSPKAGGILTVAFRSAGTVSAINETFTLDSSATVATTAAATQSTTFALTSTATRTTSPDATVATTFTLNAAAGAAKTAGTTTASIFTTTAGAVVTHPGATNVATSFNLAASAVVDHAASDSLAFTATLTPAAKVDTSGTVTEVITWGLNAAARRTANAATTVPSTFNLNASVALAHQFLITGGGTLAFTGARIGGTSAVTNPGIRIVTGESDVRVASREPGVAIASSEASVRLP